MKIRLALIAMFISTLIAACQSGPPPTQILMEVTRVVTVIVTPGPAQAQGAANTPETTATESASETRATATSIPTEASSATPTESAFPTPIVGQFLVAEQSFENGRMFWLSPINQIWVLTFDEDGNQVWEVYEDTFVEGMPESDPAFEPTNPDLRQPIRGFGLLWRENTRLRESIGYATQEEVGYMANYQYHYGGFVDEDDNYVPGPGYHLLESLSREVYRFNEEIMTWEVSNGN